MRISNKVAQEILNSILEYENILVFRHESPDFDALGSQWGMVNFLRDNFKNKNIFAPGFSNVILADGLYPENDVVDEKIYNSKFLALVLDTGNTERISDKNYVKADKIIKIDHHPNKEPYGDINLVKDYAGAACELIHCLFKTKPFRKYIVSKEAAKFLYSGLVGDTGRFQYSSTTPNTLKVGAELVKKGFDMSKDVYFPMYKKNMSEFVAIKYVMNNYTLTKNGVAYYYLDAKTLDEFNLSPDEGKIFLSLFSNYEEIKIWVCFVEDKLKGNYRGSIRSRDIVINSICENYHGGGHACASGCRFDSYEDMSNLIDDLDKEIVRLGK